MAMEDADWAGLTATVAAGGEPGMPSHAGPSMRAVRLSVLRFKQHRALVPLVHVPLGRALLVVPATEDAAPVLDGVQLPAGAVVACPPGSSCYLRGASSDAWLALSVEQVPGCAVSTALAGSGTVRALRPGAASLRALERALLSMIDARYIAGHDQDAAAGAVLHAAAICLAAPQARRPAAPSRRAVMDRFEAIAANARQNAPDMVEVSAMLGVAPRTLRACVSDFVGTSPARYMHRHRLLLVREALLHGQPRQDSVTRIALAYGFTELGRFAVAYRTLFGETPSATLNGVARVDDAVAPQVRMRFPRISPGGAG